MRFRNISSGIVATIGLHIPPGREIDLTEQQLKRSEILPYLNVNYLVAITETTEPLPEIASVRQELPENLIVNGINEGVTVIPQTSTKEELEAEQAKEDAKITVAVPTVTLDNGAAVQSVVEISADKVEKIVEELKNLAWKKRGEFIEGITDIALLQAILPEVTGKIKESVEAQIVELQKK